MSKNFKYGARKNMARKQRMRLYNLNKSLSKLEASNVLEECNNDVNVFSDSVIENDLHELRVEMEVNQDIFWSGHEIEIQANEVAISSNQIQTQNDQAAAWIGYESEIQDEFCNERNDNIEESDAMEEEAIEEEDAATNSETCNEINDSRLDGRRIVDFQFIFQQLKAISCHNYGKCSFKSMEIRKEIRVGLESKFSLQCSSCNKKFIVCANQDESITETMNLNSIATLAANMIGIGFSQLEQFASVLDLPVMSSGTFKKLNDEIGSFWEDTAEECMREAADEERKVAVDRGDVDKEDGIPFIKVVTDGCWSKRSYNKNYTALSGVASIVGAHTGKVIWIAVKNKYCVVCVRNANKNLKPPPHFCTRNYTGPSSEMEWQSIVEGFEKSVELYGVRYLQLVADGDSSTHAKLLERRPYGHRIIVKIGCSNHIKRNFQKHLETSAAGCPRGLNKIVCENFERIRKDVCCAVEYRKKENKLESEKIALLKSDLNNIVFHVFGQHTNCPEYIKNHCINDENYIPALTACGTLEKILKVIRSLVYCAKDLLLGETNNVAEHFNSIVARQVGGKRTNYSLSNGYTYQSNAAVVQFNTQSALSSFYHTKFKKAPSAIAKKIELKRLQKTRREKERRRRLKENKVYRKRFRSVKDNGSAYGVNCQTADISPDDLENEKEMFKGKLIENQMNRYSIEERSRTEKHKSELWQQIGSSVLISSSFGSICKARALAGHVPKIIKSFSAETKSIRHERESEPVALLQLAAQEGLCIRSCGVLIDEDDFFLAAAPTGIVLSDDSLVIIACPSNIFNKDLTDFSVLEKLPFIKTKDGQVLGLKETHDFYYDIQGQLHIWNKEQCLFGVWTSTNHKIFVLRVRKDDHFFNAKMKQRLSHFYNDWLLPELAEPRLTRNMEVRVPNNF